MMRPTVMLPCAIGPGECNMTTKARPSSSMPSFDPLSMRIATAALQSPSVGRAAMLVTMQGQSNAQLHVSMYCPEICQLDIASSLTEVDGLQLIPMSPRCQRNLWASICNRHGHGRACPVVNWGARGIHETAAF